MLIMTANRLRHLYFAGEMLARFPHAKVIIEEFEEETGKNYTRGEVTDAMKEHFNAFDLNEKKFFEERVRAREKALKAGIIKRLAPGTINSPENAEFIQALNPSLVVVYSTSIIKEPLVGFFAGRIFNLHAGLSPHYRGAGTNLFPFYNEELEFVGMTVHHLDAGIDSGEIILQGRPVFERQDNTHTISNKNVVLGVELMVAAAKHFLAKEKILLSRKQDLSIGKLYLKKHFNDEVLHRINTLLSEGLVEKYMQSPKSVDIVEWTE